MTRAPESDDSSVVAMADYDRRAKRAVGPASEPPADPKRPRQATRLRLVETGRPKAPPRLTLVGSADAPVD